MKKIINVCLKNNYKYNVKNLNFNVNCVEIICNNHFELDAIVKQFSRYKNIYVEVRSIYNRTLWIYNKDDKNKIDQLENIKKELVNMFFKSLKKGQTQEQAKQQQYNYCINNNCIEVFDNIYK